jgi:hypothetical protein
VFKHITQNRILELLQAFATSDSPEHGEVEADLLTLGREAVPALEELALSGIPHVSQMAARVLGKLGPEALHVIPNLIEALRGDRKEPRYQAARTALIAFGRFAVPDLLRALEQATELEPVLLVPCQEDEHILAWFAAVDLAHYLKHLQVFWCIGIVEQAAFESAGQAVGYGKLTQQLRQLAPQFNLIRLPTSITYVSGTCLPNLDGLFDREPFYSASWSEQERGLPLRDEFWNGDRQESCWTPKARTAWGYVDRFLTLRALLPVIKSPDETAAAA